MPVPRALPHYLRPRREKVFGDGRPRPLDREAKVRVMACVRALMHRTEKGKAYGQITAKAKAVAEALLWGFHNAQTGLCFPSYEKIAEKAGCARSTVAEAINALEAAGVLTWVNRIVRISERSVDLFGHLVRRVRVIRTSNGYQFNDPKGAVSKGFSSKSEFQSGTPVQESSSSSAAPAPTENRPPTEVETAITRWKALFDASQARTATA